MTGESPFLVGFLAVIIWVFLEVCFRELLAWIERARIRRRLRKVAAKYQPWEMY